MTQKNDCLLLMFAKNLILGKVKTRLAVDVGDANALKIYEHLLAYSRQITQHLSCARHVYYSDFIHKADEWRTPPYEKRLQSGDGLGERMSNAFAAGFAEGYQRVCLIGTDCKELTQTILEQAFAALAHYEIVIGPSEDGGFYLLGMREYHPQFFQNKQWSTPRVLPDVLRDISALHVPYVTLPILNDVDTVDDLGDLKQLLDD